ncbi:MAG: hypothetical protein EAX96_15970 [Candidatus Lokiarchaeota archaeon]|nr:hypothetical protein [Candidatus Lokiarchaeota archaeon]
MKYTFGASQIAADRLENISNFFNPLALSFIKENVDYPVDSAMDLGCCPGFATKNIKYSS